MGSGGTGVRTNRPSSSAKCTLPPGLSPSFRRRCLGTRICPFWVSWATDIDFFLRWKESVPRPRNVGNRDDDLVFHKFPRCLLKFLLCKPAYTPEVVLDILSGTCETW